MSTNRQSELESEYIHAFKDGKRDDATGIIEKKLPKSSRTASKPAPDHLKACRLACLIFEVKVSLSAFKQRQFFFFPSFLLILSSGINTFFPKVCNFDMKGVTVFRLASMCLQVVCTALSFGFVFVFVFFRLFLVVFIVFFLL